MERDGLTDDPGGVERDERAPVWAKGYKREDLRRITTLFNRHGEGLLRGAFDRYRDRDAGNDLDKGWLKVGPRDEQGVPVRACVVRELERKPPVRDFTGGRVMLSPGTLYCTHMAFVDEAATSSILDRLHTHHGPVAVECWQEHPGERAIVSRLRSGRSNRPAGGEYALDGGMRLAAVKIKESSAMRGLWISHDIPDPPRACCAGGRYTPYPKQELVGLAQLPLELPQDAMLALSSHPTVRDESAYAAGYSSYAADSTWTALAIRGFYDEPERVEKPGEMDRRWTNEHQQELDRELRDTPLRAGLGAAVEKVLAVLPCAGFERICLMRLAPGGELRRHTDIANPDAGASEGKLVRVHIPLISNEHCVFQSWDIDGSLCTLAMQVGSTYYLDMRKPHTALNRGDGESVHRAVDCIANAKTVAMLRNGTPAPLDEANERHSSSCM
jgi:hypothetical protein